MTALADRLREQLAILDDRIAHAIAQGNQVGHLTRRRLEVEAELREEGKHHG